MAQIVADIGGTRIRIALAREPLRPIYCDTPSSYQEGIALLIQHMRELVGDEACTMCILGVPGTLSRDKRMLVRAPHLQSWVSMPIAHDIAQGLGVSRVLLENDTALVGLGEAHYGAGKGSDIMMYLTVSTGVNGVRIVDGAIDRSTEGFEIGGQYLDHEGALHTFESLVSGSAIEKKYGVRPKELGASSPVWDRLAHIVAIGLHNTILAWSPDTVVLGGSMFKDIGISVASVERELVSLMRAFPTTPRVLHSALGDDGGLYGGVVLSRAISGL